MTEGQAVAEEVPPGYKRTEAGVVPEGWEIGRLGDIASIRNQKILPSNVDPDTLCVELEHIGQGNGQLLEVSIAQNSTSSKYCFFTGDVLFGRLRSYLRKFWHADRDGICTTEIWPLMVNTSLVDSGFLYAIVQSNQFVETASISYGTHMPRADWNVMKNLEVHLPPLPEQRAIAGALSDADGLIGALDALIEKKRAIKQAAMQQLLAGKKRLPGFEGEWRRTTIGEVADIKSGATPSTRIPTYWNGQIPWCIPTDITGNPGKYLLSTERTITVEGLKSCAASLLPAGTLLLCSRATVGEVKIATFQICTNQGFKSLVCKSEVSNEFLYYLLLILKPQMIERATGSTFLEIGKHDVASIKLKLPEYTEQRAIATLLSDMDAEIAALERRRDKAEQVKQGMMQELLTGRTRLIDPPEVPA